MAELTAATKVEKTYRVEITRQDVIDAISEAIRKKHRKLRKLDLDIALDCNEDYLHTAIITATETKVR